MATLNFKNASVYLGASSAVAAVEITEARSIEFDIDRDTEEDMSFGDEWETLLSGVKRWTASFEINHDTAQSVVFQAATADGEAGRVPWYAYPTRATTARYYYGFAYVKMNGGGQHNAAGRGTVNLSGTGPIAQN